MVAAACILGGGPGVRHGGSAGTPNPEQLEGKTLENEKRKINPSSGEKDLGAG